MIYQLNKLVLLKIEAGVMLYVGTVEQLSHLISTFLTLSP